MKKPVKSGKRTFVFLLAALLLLLLLFVMSRLFYRIDVDRVANGQKPQFTFHTIGVNDGGSSIRYGWGYQIILYHRMVDGEEGVYEVGYEHHYYGSMIRFEDGPTVELSRIQEVNEG